tara:strand:+ start:627 stop:902 length:276 start_codon:yes stop_codon:yes gene_type:complete
MKYKNIGSKKIVLLVDGNLRVIEPKEIIEAVKIFPNPLLVIMSDVVEEKSKIDKKSEVSLKSEPMEKIKKVVERHAKKKDKLQWSQLENQD